MKNLIKMKWLVSLIMGGSFFYLTNQAMAQENEFDLTVESDNEKTTTGGFGADLAKKVSFVNFNGYITNELFLPQEGISTFDNHYFNIFISSQLTKRIFIEGQLEYEHAGKDIALRYAYGDYKVSDALVVRTGRFLVPAGQFNEYLYPEYLSKTISRPWVNREISPSAWGEVGVQIRGRIKTDGILTPFYAAYVVNGLNGESGQGIRDLRENDRDSKGGNENKAVGGSLGVDIGSDIVVSANYYSGKYTPDNELNLSIMGASFYLDKEKYSIWSEFHYANQENDSTELGSSNLNKFGYFVQAGYMLTEKFETILRYDSIDLDGMDASDDRRRLTVGLNYYFAPTAVVKINYEFITDQGEDLDDNLLGVQFSVGF